MADQKWLDKMRSISTPRRVGSSRTTVEHHASGSVATTEHWDGRQDVAVRPDTARFKAVRHNSGRKRGQVAEIKKETTR